MDFLLGNLIGAVIKHGDKIPLVGGLFEKIPNNFIPFINWGVFTAMSGGDWQAGASMAGLATGAHQALKIPVRGLSSKYLSVSARSGAGPGKDFSI